MSTQTNLNFRVIIFGAVGFLRPLGTSGLCEDTDLKFAAHAPFIRVRHSFSWFGTESEKPRNSTVL